MRAVWHYYYLSYDDEKTAGLLALFVNENYPLFSNLATFTKAWAVWSFKYHKETVLNIHDYAHVFCLLLIPWSGMVYTFHPTAFFQSGMIIIFLSTSCRKQCFRYGGRGRGGPRSKAQHTQHVDQNHLTRTCRNYVSNQSCASLSKKRQLKQWNQEWSPQPSHNWWPL